MAMVRTARKRAGLRTAPRSKPHGWLGPCIWWALCAALLLPVALGWHHTALSRREILDEAHTANAAIRVEAKFMYTGDLPPVDFIPGQKAQAAGGYWVVASSSPVLVPIACDGRPPCAPPPVWSVVILRDEAPLVPTSTAAIAFGSKDQLRWPAVFDRLPDRAAPQWWPLVPPRVVAMPAALLSLLLGIAVMVRARRRGRPT